MHLGLLVVVAISNVSLFGSRESFISKQIVFEYEKNRAQYLKTKPDPKKENQTDEQYAEYVKKFQPFTDENGQTLLNRLVDLAGPEVKPKHAKKYADSLVEDMHIKGGDAEYAAILMLTKRDNFGKTPNEYAHERNTPESRVLKNEIIERLKKMSPALLTADQAYALQRHVDNYL